MQKFVITGTGHDQPGMVAELTAVLLQHQCNIEDSSMTILAGEFVVILIVSGPDSLNASTLQQALLPLEAQQGFSLIVKTLNPSKLLPPEGLPYLIRVSGQDRTGITYETAKILSDRHIDITDLHAQRIDGEAGPVYLLMVELLLPLGQEPSDLQVALNELATRLGVEAQLVAVEMEVL